MNILKVVCFVECISYLGTAWSFLKRSLLVFVLSIGMFLFSVPHSSLMMYTSVSRAFLSCFLFLAVIDTEAHVIKDSSKSSLLYSYLHWTAWFVCKPLFYLSLFLATCLIIYFPVALPSEEHTSPLLFNSLSKYISVHICLPFWHCIHKWQNPPSLPVLLLVLISGLGPSSSCLLPAPGQLLWKDCGSILACHWRDFNHSQE